MATEKKRNKVCTAAPPSTLIVDACNIRGLHSNLNAVHHHLETAKPALFFLTETQISTPADVSYLMYPGYSLEHKFVSKAGVCMFVRDDICCRRIDSLEERDLSLIWARVDLGGRTHIYACLYRSHSGDTETDRLFGHVQRGIDDILQRLPSAEVTVLGDFNGHHVEWLGSTHNDYAGKAALNLAAAYDLTQLVDGPTRIPDVDGHTPALLDLLLTSNPDGTLVSRQAPLGNSDHCLVHSVVQIRPTNCTRPSGTRRVWHYRSADWDGLREFYASYPWRQLCFSSDDVEICANAVADTILQGMESFIPSSVVRVGGKSQPWFDRSCREASNLKHAAFEAWAAVRDSKDTASLELKKRFNAVSRSCKKIIAAAKFRHTRGIGEKLISHPSGSRAFWSLAKAAQGNFCRTSLPSLRKPDGSLAHSAKEKADLLGSLFASNSTLDDGGKTPPTIPVCEYTMPEIRITQCSVRRALGSLDVSKSSGPDGISALVLRTCAPELTPVLTRLFLLSYKTGKVPSSWKVAFIHPIPKKGDRTDPSNYRPIAITSLLSKVMERVINTQLLGYLEANQLISDRQYGFRHGRGAGDLLIYLTHQWAAAIESKGEALAGSLDITKAFDRVWHKALLSKLPSYGLPNGLCTWIASFLSGRSIQVVVDGLCSKTIPINAGVPQGSVLSPTLFLLHINDMLHSGNIHCYADDSTGSAHYNGRAKMTPATVAESRTKLVSEIESTLEKVSEWGDENLVSFNPSKTQVCAFSAKKTPFTIAPQFQSTPLKISKSIGILGVEISSEVQFRGHMENKAKLASKKLGVLNRAKRYFTPGHRLLLYKAQVRPHMEYCSFLWAGAPEYQLLPLDSIQRRAIRIVDDPKLTDRLETLRHRRDVGSLCVFYRLYNGECSEELFDLVPPSRFYHRTSRHREGAHPHILDAWHPKTTRASRSFFTRTCQMWNRLPPEVFPLRYNMGFFKRCVNRSLKKAGNA